MKKSIKIFLALIVSILSIKFLFFASANKRVNQKLYSIKEEIKKKGFHNNWFVISTKRNSWYNKILINSAKKSVHLKGDAIDIYVIDINGDFKFDSEDIKIFEDCNSIVEKKHPELVGSLGTYRNKGYFTKHMIHIDTRGYKKRYNY